MKNENEIHIKQFYLGIEILRMFFAFIIVFFHCMNREIYNHIFIKFITDIVSLGLSTFFILLIPYII
jgi:peptidoglycan/LPS O-acetylase OafA/YrhL